MKELHVELTGITDHETGVIATFKYVDPDGRSVTGDVARAPYAYPDITRIEISCAATGKGVRAATLRAVPVQKIIDAVRSAVHEQRKAG